MPGYKLYLQNNEEPREGVKCSYCRLILRDPIQTTNTGQRYCRECFKEAVRYAFLISLCCYYYIVDCIAGSYTQMNKKESTNIYVGIYILSYIIISCTSYMNKSL